MDRTIKVTRLDGWSGVVKEDVLSFWHTYRIPAILAAVAVVFLIRAVLGRRRKKEISSPGSSSPPSLSINAVEKRWPLPQPPALSIAQTMGAPEKQKNGETYRKIEPSKAGPKRVSGLRPTKTSPKDPNTEGSATDDFVIQPLIFFSSLTTTTEKYAGYVLEELQSFCKDNLLSRKFLQPQINDLSYIDFDDFFISSPNYSTPERHVKNFYILLIPTYNIDTVLNTFLSHLDETHHDFRIDTAPLSGLLGYSVFGFGDREGWPTEEEGFCSQAKEVDRWMAKLTGRRRAYPLGMGDVKSNARSALTEWTKGITEALRELSSTGSLGEGVPGSGDPLESDEEEEEAVPGELEPDDQSLKLPKRKRQAGPVSDLEDIRFKGPSDEEAPPSNAPLAIDFTTYSAPKSQPDLKEMVPKTSPTYAALTKQGYTIIGSHSGVKICRWTKSALRGRGSCYKYSFYGIQSHLCMETTPSLSCSNKCVFCWRHGTNPVGTTWRWTTDPPDMIFAGAKEGHYKKIKMMKGVPGVVASRFAEAMRIRHCALSLVGEPIFYPHINELVSMMHAERISTFLVCNAQHPAQLAALQKVTQLYVSIDASNKESLRKIDRPLHRDFWERFNACLDILRERRFKQRTVFRLTLVKGFNIDDEVEGYAALVEKGLPCFVEIKGVTYCGTSTSSSAGLTMQNVPFYTEITEFVTALNAALERRGLEYGIAAEHAHSCCVLIASKRFLVDGKWHTVIGYEKFFELLEKGEEFGPEDYMGAPTQEWALWGNGGFDPRDERVYRKGKNAKANLARAEKEAVEEVVAVED
jgi:tRNA wybutosine-synthesizing protein 1